NSISDFNFWADVPEGVYYRTFEVTFDNANLEKAFFITEPIHIKQKHEGTVLQQYSNSWNKDNVMFEQNSQLLEMRVHGEVMDYQALVDRYVFETQDYK